MKYKSLDLGSSSSHAMVDDDVSPTGISPASPTEEESALELEGRHYRIFRELNEEVLYETQFMRLSRKAAYHLLNFPIYAYFFFKEHPLFFVEVLIWLLYYLIGVIYYSNIEGWSITDSIYFITVTFSTIGYGQFRASTDDSRVFTAFYCVFGIMFVLTALNRAASRWLMRAQAPILDFFLGRKPHLPQTKIVFSLTIIFMVLFLGLFVYVKTYAHMERWDYAQAFYWTVTTMTTVGYGDLELRNEGSRAFGIFFIYICIAVYSLALQNLYNSFQDIRVVSKRVGAVEHVRKTGIFKKSMVAETLADMLCEDDCSQFVLATLLRLKKLHIQDDLEPIIKFWLQQRENSQRLDALTETYVRSNVSSSASTFKSKVDSSSGSATSDSVSGSRFEIGKGGCGSYDSDIEINDMSGSYINRDKDRQDRHGDSSNNVFKSVSSASGARGVVSSGWMEDMDTSSHAQVEMGQTHSTRLDDIDLGPGSDAINVINVKELSELDLSVGERGEIQRQVHREQAALSSKVDSFVAMTEQRRMIQSGSGSGSNPSSPGRAIRAMDAVSPGRDSRRTYGNASQNKGHNKDHQDLNGNGNGNDLEKAERAGRHYNKESPELTTGSDRRKEGGDCEIEAELVSNPLFNQNMLADDVDAETV